MILGKVKEIVVNYLKRKNRKYAQVESKDNFANAENQKLVFSKLNKITELRKDYDELVTLMILELIKEEENLIMEELIAPKNSDEIYASIGRSDYDIPVGVKFDTLIELNSLTIQKVDFEILEVSVRRGDHIDVIIPGMGGIGLLKFAGGIPKEVLELPEISPYPNSSERNKIFLTTKEFGTKLIDSLKSM